MTDESAARSTMRAYLADLWHHSPGRVTAVVALGLLVGLTESIGLLMLVPLLSLVGATDGTDSPITDAVRSALDALGVPFTLGWVLVVYVVLVSLRALLVYWRSIETARVRLEFVDHLRLRLFGAVARANWLFHIERRSSDISHAITSDLNRVNTGTFFAFEAVSRVIITTAYLVVAFRLSTPITLIALALAALMSLVLWPQVKRSRDLGALQTATGRQSFSNQSEFLSGMKLAKSHANESQHVGAYREEVTNVRRASLGFQRVSALTTAAFQIGAVLSVAVVVWLAVEVVEVPSAELLALVVVISRIAPAGSGILNQVQGAANMLPAYESAQTLLGDARRAQEPVFDSGSTAPLEREIELREVGFSYKTGPPALIDVSLELPARRTTALVGPSGAGKTTLADVILGLIEPQEGLLLIDGVPLAEVGLDSWRGQLAYVPQEAFLFHDTLRANITWGADDLSDDEIDELVDAAAVGPLIARLPDGLATVVGDRGHRLSGGERQRVALARALARRPSLLVLDEATSALDRENERSVQEAIDRLHGELTMVVIAHRLGTVRHADQVAVIDHGRLVESGSWDQLIAADGRLASLAAAAWSEEALG